MKKITINNFRKIKGEWDIKLSPVTFFVGPNNSGKSSVLKSLLLLDDYGNSNDHFTLKFNKEHANNHKIDCYSNALNRYNLSGKNFDIEFKIENELYAIEFCFFPYEYVGEKFEKGKLKSLKFNSNIDNSFLSINHISANEYQVELDTNFYYKTRVNDEIFEDVKSYEAMLFTTLQNIEQKNKNLINLNNLKERITLKNEVEDLNKFTKKLKDKIKDLNNRLSRNNHILQPKINLGEFDSFRNLDRVLLRALSFYINDDKTNKGYTNKKSEMQKITTMLESISDSLKLNLSHLSPNRNTQTRLYVNGEKSNDIYSIINEFYENSILKNSEADEFLKYWMVKFDIGEDYKITPLHGLATIIEINEVSDDNNNSWINLVDKGFGAGQIFSILLRIATSINKLELQNNSKSKSKATYFVLKEKPILLIEEPEANLHPKFQSLLAEMFYQAAITFGLQFIVETHSEYMIRNSQLIYLKQANEESDVFSIYYFDKEGPYQMNFRKDGRFTNQFGPGFFDVNSNLIFDLP